VKRGHSSAGRASALQAEGRRFDPDWLHQEGGVMKVVEEEMLEEKDDQEVSAEARGNR
jgi:hypothetical protein